MPVRTVALRDYELILLTNGAVRNVGLIDLLPTASLAQATEDFAANPEFFGGSPGQVPITQNIAVLRTAGLTILVDTGLPVDFPDAWLGDVLQEAGISPESIDLVVLTHRDWDHVGGNMRDGLPVYPRAQYVIPTTEYHSFAEDEAKAELFVSQIQPLVDLGQLDVVADDAEVAPGVRYWLTPGHRPGTTSVLIGDEAVLLADTLHFAIQVRHPKWSAKFDSDPGLAAETRRAVLSRAARENLLLAVPHIPDFGLGRIGEVGDSFIWQPAA